MQSKVPQHVAIIMDGNGRWATKRGHPRMFGHVRGTQRVKQIVRAANDAGVKALTLYAFSTENWTRPNAELSVLWKLLKKFLTRELDEMDRQNVRIQFIGETDRLANDVQEVIKTSVNRLAKNTGLRLTFCISYGSRRELSRAAAHFAQDCREGKVSPDQMDEALMGRYLWTSELGELADVDLVIRTSGEKRVSNFLLWQAAYAEFIFMDLLWPDFQARDFQAALEEYSHRNRRYGGLVETTV